MKKLTSLLLIFTLSFFNITNVALAATFTTATEADFDEGNYDSNTRYFENNLQIEGYTISERELPDGNDDSGWIDMSNNELNLHLNEASGATSFTDTSTANLTMSCSGNECPSHTTEGKMSNSFMFDGTDFISGNGPNLALTNDFTISAWVKDASPSTSAYKGIAGKMVYDSTNYKGYLIRKNSSHKFSFSIGDNNLTTLDSSGTYNDAIWHHVVGIYNNGYMYLYVDGNLENQSINQVNITDSGNDFIIGDHYADYGSYHFNGNIDEVAVWSRALSSNEISTIYNRQINKYSTNSGAYISKIFDSTNTESAWNNISWNQEICYQCELPNNQATENTFIDNRNMDENIALFHLNDAENSTNFIDSSGHNLTGTCTNTNCPTSNLAGKFDKAIEFYSGQDPNSISISGINENTFGNGEGTIEMWIAPTQNSYDYLFHHRNDNNDRVMLIWNIQQNQIGANIAQGSSYAYATWDEFSTNTSNWNIDGNEWHHIALTFDKNTAAGNDNMWLYIDGELKKSAEGTRSLFPSIKDSSETKYVWLGNHSSNSSQYGYHGKMDEIAIYNRALEESEIKNSYSRGILNLEIETRSCNDSNCSGETFTDINQTSPATLTLADNQYFQYQFALSSENAEYSPKIESVNISYTPPGGGGGGVPEFSDYTYALTLIIGMLLIYNYGNFEISYSNSTNKTGK